VSTKVESSSFALPAADVAAPLDPLFRPAALARRAFERRARETGHPIHVRFALEQNAGAASRFALELMPEGHPDAHANLPMLERLVKLALWARGGYRISLDAPARLVEELRTHFRDTPTGRFDSEIVGQSVYGHPIEVVAAHELPPERSTTTELGGHLDGCRIGFDLGGSAAGVYVDNQVKFASLFRGVARDAFEKRVRNIFRDLKHAWHDVPFDVANDGDVTALMGSMSLGGGGVLGIALGTSTAGGFVTADGRITPWLNEIAFVPVDYRADAPRDEWSGDRGCIVQYLSQQAVGRLHAPAGIDLPHAMPLPAKLKEVQSLMKVGDPRARKIYETVANSGNA